MRFFLKRNYLRDELDKIVFLHYLFWSTFIFAFFLRKIELDETLLGLESFIQFIFCALVFRYHLKTLKMLYYSFWTFTFFVAFYGVHEVLFPLFSEGTLSFFSKSSMFYFISLGVGAVECFLLFSPLYYPRIRWWEYDFRYRGDIPTTLYALDNRDEKFSGRLTDLRAGAACIILFQELEINQRVVILCDFLQRPWEFEGVILSKREYSYGRGLSYGIKLLLDEEGEEKLVEFQKHYREYRHKIIKEKKNCLEER